MNRKQALAIVNPRMFRAMKTKSEMVVWAFLSSCDQGNGESILSIIELKHKSKISERTIRKALKSLVELDTIRNLRIKGDNIMATVQYWPLTDEELRIIEENDEMLRQLEEQGDLRK